MGLPVKFSETAVDQLKVLSSEKRAIVVQDIEKMAENGIFGVKSVKLVESGFDSETYRLKVKEEGLDHRVFFRLAEGTEIIVDSIIHRDQAYQD